MKEWSINDKRIFQFIKQVKRRLSLQLMLNVLILALAAGFFFATIIQIISIFVPMYWANMLSVFIILLCTLAGVIYAIFHFPDKKKAAYIADSKGLEEHLLTSMELFGTKTYLGELQKESTIRRISDYSVKEKLPFRIQLNYFVILTFLCLSFFIVIFIPSTAREEAKQIHQLNMQAETEIEKIETVKEQMKKIEEFSKTDTKELEELFEQTVEELKQVKKEEDITKAKERLETKLEKQIEKQDTTSKKENLETLAKSLGMQTKKEQENLLKQEKIESLKQQLENSFGDLLKKDALEKWLEELSLKEFDELLEYASNLSKKELEKLAKELSNMQLSEEQLQQLAKSLKEAATTLASSPSNQKKMENISAKASISAKQQSNSNKGNKAGNGSGNGSGNSSGNSSGNGSGSGTGSGSGSGSGTGWNYGSKQGKERESNRNNEAERVAIPDRTLGEDENLTGTATEGGESYSTSSQEGMTWSGEKVTYEQVISEYTKEAYSKIKSNKVPTELEEVVKSYFEGLNQ